MQQDYTIWNGTSGWKQNRGVQVSYNTTSSRFTNQSESQVGGMVAFQDVAFRITEQGQDEIKLSRRPYTTITGYNVEPHF